jgi:alginate O-acetyltransferase complex protein AlgJ
VALMRTLRRPLALVVVALLTVPALGMSVADPRQVSRGENRRLAEAPSAPRTSEDWRRLPRALDAYLADHFAFRTPLLAASRRVERALGGRAGGKVAARGAVFSVISTAPGTSDAELPKAVTGRGGQMFLVQGLLQSTGQEIDPTRAGDFVDFVCRARDRRATRGIRLLAGMAPSPGEIIPEDAPDWAAPAGRLSEQDLILKGLARCGVDAVDLRPTLISAKPRGRLYRRTDSHWTPLGALLAYDHVVRALGRSEWQVDPSSLTWNPLTTTTGDLPRMLGAPPVPETVAAYDNALPAGVQRRALAGLESGGVGPWMAQMRNAGTSVLIIGDSYTDRDYFPPLFARFVARIAWTHMDNCHFDWRVMDRVKPDYVLILPVARNAHCDGDRPRHIDGW